MKKYIFLLAFIGSCAVGHAESMKEFIDSFSGKDGVERIKVGSWILKLTNAFTDTKITGVEIFDLSECDAAVKQTFQSGLHRLNDPKYEPLVYMTEADEVVRIFVRMDGEVVRELVVASSDSDGHALVHIKGKMDADDLKEIIDGIK